ncbi:MAG: DedA family protein [Microthrixaceae bacterium]
MAESGPGDEPGADELVGPDPAGQSAAQGSNGQSNSDGSPADAERPTIEPDAVLAPVRRPGWLLPLIGASIVALVIANNIGNVVWASWIIEHPLGLLALNSSNKYLIGTTPGTGWLEVLFVSTGRLMAPDPLFYMVGYIYRDNAVHWARRVFPASGKLFDQLESDRGQFARILDALVFIMPNNPVCLIAGVVGMSVKRFLVLAVAGTIGRIILMRGIGTVFSDQIEDILEYVARYQRWLLIGSVVLVVGYVLWQLRSHKGLLGGVEDLEDELGD